MGQVSYKKIHVNQLMQSIQMGIQNSIGAMSRYDERDLLMQDFMTVETVVFPKSGSKTTQVHSFSDFTFRTVAPLAFRYFLNLFGIKREDFMVITFLSFSYLKESKPPITFCNLDLFVIETYHTHMQIWFRFKAPSPFLTPSKSWGTLQNCSN